MKSQPVSKGETTGTLELVSCDALGAASRVTLTMMSQKRKQFDFMLFTLRRADWRVSDI